MAVIIIVVILVLIAICGYIRCNAKDARKRERNFYDIFFLFKFFEYLLRNDDWNEFVQNNMQIEVKRSIFELEKGMTKDSLGIEENYFLDLTNKNNTDEYEKKFGEENYKNFYIIYEFKLNKKNVKFCMVIGNIHNKMFHLLNHTVFMLNIDAQKLKMTLTESFAQPIYISSYTAAMQSLMFILQVLQEEPPKKFLRDGYTFFEETNIIIDHLKLQNIFVIGKTKETYDSEIHIFGKKT